MATKKTKNTRNATEYIDSAGVKLNNNADLIIEANAAGDVISARNLINGQEYVGGGAGGGGGLIVHITPGETPTADKTFTEVLAAYNAEKYIVAEVMGTIHPLVLVSKNLETEEIQGFEFVLLTVVPASFSIGETNYKIRQFVATLTDDNNIQLGQSEYTGLTKA